MTDYKFLCEALKGFIEADPSYIPVLSNASALLFDALADLNWAGFYVARDAKGGAADAPYGCPEGSARELVVGPFQGKPACILIPFGKGVCGTAAVKDELQLVPDVHKFPGHIACDSASNSEIVIPIHRAVPAADGPARREVAAVLDIDSPLFDRFSDADAEGLQAFVRVLEEDIRWEF